MDGPEHPTRKEALRAAEEVTASDTLLHGEQAAIDSGYREDAETWLGVYEELFAFKQELLAELQDQVGRVSGEGRHEVQNDEILLTREADRLARRLEFWQAELERRLSRKQTPG